MKAHGEAARAAYQALFQHIPHAVLEVDFEGRVRLANPGAVRLLRTEEVEGQQLRELLGKAGRRLEGVARNVIDAGAPSELSLTVPAVHGSQHVRAHGAPVQEEGDVRACVLTLTLVPPQEPEAAEPAAEEQLLTLVKQSLVTLYIIQHDALAYVNRAAEVITGYRREELMAPSFDLRDLIHEDDWPQVQENLRRRLEGDLSDIRYTVRLRHKDGSTIYADVHGMRGDYRGEPAIIGLLVDITARVEYEQRLIAAKEKAEEMNRVKTAFLANMSHEIRTPLTAVIGFADVLAGEVEPEHRELVGYIRQGGARLMETLDSVLNLAQLEGRAFRIRPEWIDLRAFVEERLALFRPQAAHHDLTLSLDVEADEASLRAYLDPAALGRILNNLVGNAIKFTSEGQVTVTLSADEENVILQVEDTGVGISTTFLPRLFDEFEQESSGTTRTFEGSGLGLAITRRLVEIMSGSISVESEQGEGTTFTVRLPREPVEENE